jgi:hypothetical protein
VNDLEVSNRKAAGENGELSRQLEEVDQHVSQLHKLRHQLNSQLEDVKKTYEEEAKERQSLLGRLVTKTRRIMFLRFCISNPTYFELQIFRLPEVEITKKKNP